MKHSNIEIYISQKLGELEKEKDMTELKSKGKLSFGMNSQEFGHLPSWERLVKKKKTLVKMIWLTCFMESILIVGIISDAPEKFDISIMKAIVYWLAMSAIVMFFYLVWSYYSLFYYFRQAEREVRKLIYEDILYQIEKEKTKGD